jgi:hypothetical protein
MNTVHRTSKWTKGHATKAVASAMPNESPAERVARIYRSPGGPLVGWLFNEARRRGTPLNTMARSLGVTYGYISQLRNGIRSSEYIGHNFAEAAASYLGVPTIAVKLVAGQIRLSDFLPKHESEEDAIKRAFRHVKDDIRVRMSTPVGLSDLPLEAKRAIVLLHSENSGSDTYGTGELPGIVRSLCQATRFHAQHQLKANSDQGDGQTPTQQ